MYSIHIDGACVGKLQGLECTKRENIEILFKLFGFNKVMMGYGNAYKENQNSADFEDYQTSGEFDYSLIEKGVVTIESLNQDERVRLLLKKGYAKYLNNKSVPLQTANTTPVEVITLQDRVLKINNALSIAVSKEDEVKARRSKHALIQEMKPTILAKFEDNLKIAKIKYLESIQEKNQTLTALDLTNIVGIINRKYNDTFINELVWELLNSPSLDNCNTILSNRIGQTHDELELEVSKFISEIKPPKNDITIVANQDDIIPVIDETIRITNIPTAEIPITYIKPPLSNPIIRSTPLVNFKTLFVNNEIRLKIINRVNTIFNNKEFLEYIHGIQPNPIFTFAETWSATDFKLRSQQEGYPDLSFHVTDKTVTPVNIV